MLPAIVRFAGSPLQACNRVGNRGNMVTKFGKTCQGPGARNRLFEIVRSERVGQERTKTHPRGSGDVGVVR